jgi:hypothetical protein
MGMNREFTPYDRALKLKELGFNEPCLANLIGFGDGTKENGRYKINYQQVFYPNDYTSSDDKSEELGLYPFGICGVPLSQQAFRWFREKYFIVGYIVPKNGKYTYYIISNNIKTEMNGFKTYEEAELACLDKMIEIVESKNK